MQADIDPQPLLADASPLRVAVIEASSQHFETGLSYNTDVGPRVELRYNNQDIFDSAWRFRTGLARREDPGPAVRLRFAAAARGPLEQLLRARAAAGHPERADARVRGRHGVQPLRAPRADAILVSAHLEEQRVADRVTDNRYAVYLGFRHAFRQTDDLVLPREGFLGTFEVGGAPAGPVVAALPAGVASGSVLLALGPRDDLLMRGQAGVVAARRAQGIPTTFLFRTGGDQTVRGYDFESLGVRQGDAIVGGRRLAVGSVEYTHWIGEAWGARRFFDAGDAWDERHELQSQARLRPRRTLPHADRSDPRRSRLWPRDQRIPDALLRRLQFLR